MLRRRCLVVSADDSYLKQLQGTGAVREETVSSPSDGGGTGLEARATEACHLSSTPKRPARRRGPLSDEH